MWHNVRVKLWRIIRMLLPVLAIVGLITAPLATPVAAGTMAPVPMTTMADDMPCCPPEKPAMPDCGKSCTLMAVCMAKCFQSFPTTESSELAPLALARRVLPGSDTFGTGLAQAPPSRPPRT